MELCCRRSSSAVATRALRMAQFELEKKDIEACSSLRILTYNFFLRPPLLNEAHGDFKEERLRQFMDLVLPKYDIILLQEMFTAYSSRAQRLIEHARQSGFYFHVLGPQASMLRGRLVDSGLVLLSRWRVSNSDICLYDHGVTVDRLASKGATYSCHVNDTKRCCMHLFSTHLQASYSTAPVFDTPTVACRTKQLQQLAGFIDTKLSLQQLQTANDAALDTRLTGDNNDFSAYRHIAMVTGDLNINSMQEGRQEYRQLINILSHNDKYEVKDLLGANAGVTQVPWEWLSFKRDEYGPEIEKKEGSRLDYILLICRKSGDVPTPFIDSEVIVQTHPDKIIDEQLTLTSMNKVKTIDKKHELGIINIDIQAMRVESPHYLQLSDHFGVELEISLESTEKSATIF